MKLYFSPGACSLSPHIVACEAGIDLTLQKVDLRKKELDGGGDYWKVNGKGYVPALEIEAGQVLTEGPAIVQYLADSKPGAGLMPTSPLERARVQEWLNFITSEIHKGYSPLFNKALPEDQRQAAIEKLSTRLAYAAQQLEGKQFLVSNRFTVADAYLFTVLRWSPFTGIDLDKWPALKDYAARIAARPKVKEAMSVEGILKS
jgi:glutathione S-transferase